MKKPKLAPCLAVLVAACCTGGSVALAQEVKTVEVKGESEVDYETARQKALRQAVRQVAGVELHSMTKVRSFELIRETIYSRATGYVRSYKVLAKRRGLDDTYIVDVRAEVARGKIGSDALAIKTLIEEQGRPQFVVALPEKTDRETRVWVEGAMIDYLEKTGLSVLYVKVRDEAKVRRFIRAVAAGDKATARLLKTEMGAPYAMDIAATTNKKTEQVYRITTNFAAVELRVIVANRDDAEILASKDAKGSARSTDTSGVRLASKYAVDEVFPQVLKRILYHWTRDLDVGMALTVRIAGAPYAVVSDLRQKVAAFEGVNSARIVEAPEGGIAVIRVIGRFRASAIADRIPEWSGGRLRAGLEGPRVVTATFIERGTSAPSIPATTDEQATGERRKSPGPGAPGTATKYTLAAVVIAVFLLVAIVAAALILRRR